MRAFAAFAILSLASAAPLAARRWRSLAAREKADYRWSDFVVEFEKVYSGEEAQSRQEIFEQNLAKIQQHNKAGASWTAGVNAFTDLTVEEFRQITRGRSRFSASVAAPERSSATLASADLPDSKDWRTNQPPVVTAVKNQGGCGSCWAFSATQSVESAVAIATGKLLTLAPQEYVDCVQNPLQCGGTGGCQGATAELAFNHTMSVGQGLESDYKYKGSDGTCKEGSGLKPAVGLHGFVKLPVNNYSALIGAVVNVGPISISVDAGALGWQLYERGVFEGCPKKTLFTPNPNVAIDHAVQLLGYGADGGKDYYLVRNSWGAAWGEKGYIRIVRHANNETCFTDKTPKDGNGCKVGPPSLEVCGPCGILSDSSYPTGGFLR